jgi:GNAT superfamily N-acetyltransferase
MSKLHMVAISGDQRGRGHGRRLVNHALNRLTPGGTRLVYGQLGGDRDLRGFYDSLGFDVLRRGEPLNKEVATGIPGFGLQAQPEDTFFARANLPPGARQAGGILGR